MATMTIVRASYNAFANMVTGQIGEPAFARPVPLRDGFLLYVRRDDPARPAAFHLEHARESFGRHEEWFTNHFGSDFVGSVAALFDKVSDVSLSGLEEEEMRKALSSAIARVEVEVPALDGPQEWAKEAYEAWERGTDR